MVAGSVALLTQLPGLERQIAPAVLMTTGGTAYQIFLVPWTSPANANGYLEKLIISNQNAAAGTINFWDADITSTGTVPTARGSNAAPLIPTINVGAGAQVFLGYDLCPNVDLQAGLVAQASNATWWVQAQVVLQIG